MGIDQAFVVGAVHQQILGNVKGVYGEPGGQEVVEMAWCGCFLAFLEAA